MLVIEKVCATLSLVSSALERNLPSFSEAGAGRPLRCPGHGGTSHAEGGRSKVEFAIDLGVGGESRRGGYCENDGGGDYCAKSARDYAI